MTSDEARPDTRTPEILLWVDLETAPRYGPNARQDTILEAAWTVTRRRPATDLRWRDAVDHFVLEWQLTPLRSRLCGIAPHSEGALPFAGVVQPRDPGGWTSAAIHPAAAQMHDASGLTWDHLRGQAGERVIHAPETLERLILDDLDDACDQMRHEAGTKGVRTIIAGAGVGHYDQPLLGRGQFRALARRWHYRPHDVSHIVHGLCDDPQPVQRLLASPVAHELGVTLAESLLVDPRADVAGGMGVEVLREWVAADAVAHRAAPDVVRSMLTDLVVRTLVGDRLTAAVL